MLSPRKQLGLVAESSKAKESLRFFVEPQRMHLDLMDEQEVALAKADHRSVKAEYMQHQTLAAAVSCRTSRYAGLERTMHL